MRRCQIRVHFEYGARTKFLAALFQPMTSMSVCVAMKEIMELSRERHPNYGQKSVMLVEKNLKIGKY